MKIQCQLVGLLCWVGSMVSCTKKPDADTVYAKLTAGECQFISLVDGELFYPEDSRFKGQVIVTDQSVRINLFDQYESNTILTVTRTNLFARRPIVQLITLNEQALGSVMIGRLSNKKKRTGEGLLMTQGTMRIDRLSEEKVVIRLTGMVGNFNTLRDSTIWKPVEGLLVYRKPVITMPLGRDQTLFY